MEKQNEMSVTINGKDYLVSDLEQDEQRIVSQLHDIEAQLGQIEFKHEQMSASKLFFSDKLIDMVKNRENSSQDESSEQDFNAE